MKLHLLRSMWAAPAEPAALVAEVLALGLDGVEGPPPETPAGRRELRARLGDAGLVYVAEAATGLPRAGESPPQQWWMAHPTASPQRHLDDLDRTIEGAVDVGALLVSGMAGYDAWSMPRTVGFLEALDRRSADAGLPVTAETHRGRCLYNPWTTRDALAAVPGLELTCDFSHWCVVAERLIDSEEEIVRAAAARCRHVHGRIGWAQSAQVADPRDPAHADAVAAHERWWDAVWDAQEARGFDETTMTIEFGTDGYLPVLPFTRQPVADLRGVIRHVADRQRERFAARTPRVAPPTGSP